MLLQAATADSMSTTLITSLVGIIGAGGLVKLTDLLLKFIKERRKVKADKDDELGESLKERVEELKKGMEEMMEKIDALTELNNTKILKLSTDNAKLKTENKYLNEELAEKDAEIALLKTQS